MQDLQKGQLVEVCRCGRVDRGVLVDFNDDEIIITTRGNYEVLHIKQGSIEYVKPHTPTSDILLGTIVVAVLLVFVGLGVFFGYVVWGFLPGA